MYKKVDNKFKWTIPVVFLSIGSMTYLNYSKNEKINESDFLSQDETATNLISKNSVSLLKEGDTFERSFQDLSVGCTDFKDWQRDTSADYLVCGMTLHNDKWTEDAVDPNGINGWQLQFCHTDAWSNQYTSDYTTDWQGEWSPFVMCPKNSWISDVMVKHDGTGNMGIIGLSFYCRDENYKWTGTLTPVDGVAGEGFQNFGEWKPWLAKEEYPLFVSGMSSCDHNPIENKMGVVDLYIE